MSDGTVVESVGGIRIPSYGASDGELDAFVSAIVNRNNGFRRRNTLRMWLMHWAYKGVQWLMPPYQIFPSDSSGYRVESIRTRRVGIPHPVDNYISTFVDDEAARLGARQQEPKVRPSKSGSRASETAAKLATAVLTWDLKRCEWDQVLPEFIRQFVRSGVGILHTYLEELPGEFQMVARPDAVQCMGSVTTDSDTAAMVPLSDPCGIKMASASVTPEEFGQLVQGGMQHLDNFQDGDEAIELTQCPGCGGQMVPYQPGEDELEESDLLGRAFGERVPKMQPAIEALPWWEMYPENGGRRTPARKMRFWGRRAIRSIEWCRERFPEVGDLQPDATLALMRSDPEIDFAVDNDPQGYIAGMGASNAETFIDSVVVREVHLLPRTYPAGLEDGMSIYVFGDASQHVARRPFMVEMPGPSGKKVKIPRVGIHTAQFKPDGDNFWSRTAGDDMLPIQQSLNMLDSQVEDIRDKGTPQVVMRPSEDFVERFDAAGVLSVYEWDTQDPNANFGDRIINAVPLTGNAYLPERDKKVEALTRLGAKQIDVGQHTKGATTATEILEIAERAKQARGERNEQVDGATQRAFKHMLELRWAYQHTMEALPDDVVMKLSKDKVQVEAFEGADILGETDVVIEAAPGSDKTTATRASINFALEQGLYDLDSREAKDQLLDALDAPKLDAEKSAQLKAAQDAWAGWMERGDNDDDNQAAAPAVFDESIHDAAIWYAALGKCWLDEDAREMQARAEWDDVLRSIGGWGPTGWGAALQVAQQDEMAQRQLYEGQPIEQWPVIYEQASQLAAAAAQAPSVVQSPLTRVPPPPGIGPDGTPQWPPRMVADKLLLIWQGMIPPATVNSPQTHERDEARARLLPMYALIMQCALAAQQQAAAAQAPQMPAATTAAPDEAAAQAAQPAAVP